MFARRGHCFLTLVLVACTCLFAAPPWAHTDPQRWSDDDVQRILNDSPWSLRVSATFPDPREREPIPAQNLPGAAQAGMAGPQGVSDGRWDGGVGNNHGGGALPSVPVLVRWESSQPVRAAQQRLHKKLDIPEKDYVLSVSGLVPAGQTGGEASLPTSSSSGEATTEAQRTERNLEGFMTNSALVTATGTLHPVNVRIERESGMIVFFFPRGTVIGQKAKTVIFETRYGSLTVRARFRVSEMRYGREPAL